MMWSERAAALVQCSASVHACQRPQRNSVPQKWIHRRVERNAVQLYIFFKGCVVFEVHTHTGFPIKSHVKPGLGVYTSTVVKFFYWCVSTTAPL